MLLGGDTGACEVPGLARLVHGRDDAAAGAGQHEGKGLGPRQPSESPFNRLFTVMSPESSIMPRTFHDKSANMGRYWLSCVTVSGKLRVRMSVWGV